MAGYRWRSHPFSPMTPTAPWPPHAISISAGKNPTFSLRFQVTQKDCPRLRRRSSLVFLSTSHCCSRENSMLRRLKPICAGWSGASRPGLTRRFPRLPRSLSAAGMSRSVDWDVAISGKVPGELANRLGIAVAQRTYNAYLALLASRRFQRAANAGARVQRLLWASTGTKDPKAADTLYVEALAAPFTISTIPDVTLKAFGDHGKVGELLAPDGGDCEKVLASFVKAGINIYV